MNRPTAEEYNPYFEKYIQLVPDEHVIYFLNDQLKSALKFFEKINDEKSNYRYAEDKWSIKQILGHLIDTEQIFAYRALRFARDEKESLLGFDENAFVDNANFDELSFSDLVEQFIHLRKHTVLLFKNFDKDFFSRHGLADGKEFSVKSIPYIIAGHFIHHKNVIEERYLSNV